MLQDSQLSSTPSTYLPLPTFLSSPYPIAQPPSLASRLITTPLLWGFSKLNPFGPSSSAPKAVDDEKVWKRLKGVRVVHLGLVEASPLSAHTIEYAGGTVLADVKEDLLHV